MSHSSNFLLSGSSRKKSPSVGSKKLVVKKLPRKKATVASSFGSGGIAANPGDANVLGHSIGQGKPLGMVDGSKFSDVDTVLSNPEIVSLDEKNLSSVSLLSTSESLVKRHTNPTPVNRFPISVSGTPSVSESELNRCQVSGSAIPSVSESELDRLPISGSAIPSVSESVLNRFPITGSVTPSVSVPELNRFPVAGSVTPSVSMPEVNRCPISGSGTPISVPELDRLPLSGSGTPSVSVPDSYRSQSGSTIPFSALPISDCVPINRVAVPVPVAAASGSNPFLQFSASRFGLRGQPNIGLLPDTRSSTSVCVSDTAASLKRHVSWDAAVASPSDPSISPKRQRTGSEPVIHPRVLSSGITFPPSTPPAPPEVWDWMRAFASAFHSVTPVPVPPVPPVSVPPVPPTLPSSSRPSSFHPSSFHPPSIPVLPDPVVSTAEVSGAESVSPSQSPERVSGVCAHPVSSLFVSPPHSPSHVPQATGGLFYSDQNRGGPCEQWDSDSIAHSSVSGAGDEASVPPVSLAAEALELFHKYVPDSCVIPEVSRGRRGFLATKSDSVSSRGLLIPDLHKEEFLQAAKDVSGSAKILKRQVGKYAFVDKDFTAFLRPKHISPKLEAVASRLGKKFGTRAAFDKSDVLLYDLSALVGSGLQLSIVMDMLVELLANADDLQISGDDRVLLIQIMREVSGLLFSQMSVTSNAVEKHRRVSALTTLGIRPPQIPGLIPQIPVDSPHLCGDSFSSLLQSEIDGDKQARELSVAFRNSQKPTVPPKSGKKKSKSSGSRRGNVGPPRGRPRDFYPAEDDYFEHGRPPPRDVPFREAPSRGSSSKSRPPRGGRGGSSSSRQPFRGGGKSFRR